MTDRELNRRVFLQRSAAVAAGTAALTTLPAWAGPATAEAAPAERAPHVPDVDVRPAAKADPTEATVAEAITLLRRRSLRATDLVEAHLDRIAKFDSVYQAFNAVTAAAGMTAPWASIT